MLKHLYIKNYALIDELDMDFHDGFSVITGETGAGKSIILGAIALLMGQRADTKAIKANCNKCIIEAQFENCTPETLQWLEDNELLDADETTCIIRRELVASGKSRGFINDTPATLPQLKEIGTLLIDVHSQHQNLLLNNEDFHLGVLDTIADNATLRTSYLQTFHSYNNALKELNALKQKLESSRKEEELIRFQLAELTEARLNEGEKEELEKEQNISQHTEEIKSSLYEAGNILNNDNGVLDALRTANSRISAISDVFPDIRETAKRLDSAYIELKDIANEISQKNEDLYFDEGRLQLVNERLDLIYTLLRKYRKETVKELIEEQKRLSSIIQSIDNSDEDIKELEKKIYVFYEELERKASLLTKSRTGVASQIEKHICDRLSVLGMPGVDFKVEITQGGYTPDGQDSISFLFSANKGMPMRPVTQVASGGEISRLMLTLKDLLCKTRNLPTIIFDEIDTGVSGKIAEKMAGIMNDMAETGVQVISITHLPQIAAIGTHHYKVEKSTENDATLSNMRQLSQKERIEEIAQMLSGETITEAARSNAKTLLKIQ